MPDVISRRHAIDGDRYGCPQDAPSQADPSRQAAFAPVEHAGTKSSLIEPGCRPRTAVWQPRHLLPGGWPERPYRTPQVSGKGQEAGAARWSRCVALYFAFDLSCRPKVKGFSRFPGIFGKGLRPSFVVARIGSSLAVDLYCVASVRRKGR